MVAERNHVRAGTHEIDREPRRDAVAARGVLAVDDKEVGLIALPQNRNGGANRVPARLADHVAKKNELHEGRSVGAPREFVIGKHLRNYQIIQIDGIIQE
jgi:hypothetical protein